MTNRLTKDIGIGYKPGKPGTLGSPGLVGSPARSTKTKRRVCIYVRPDEDEVRQYGDNIGISGNRVCYDEEISEITPAIPSVAPVSPTAATPATLIYDYKIGWTGRAHSRQAIESSGSATFTVPAASSGVVIGLSPEPATSGFLDIAFGFFVSHGVVRVYESGQEAQYIGFYPGAVLKVQRAGGYVRYFVDGTEVRSRKNDAAAMFLAAALYSGGDTVLDASIEDFASGGGEATFPAPMAFGGVSWSYGIAEFPAMTADGFQARTGSGAAAFPPMTAYGGIQWAEGSATMAEPMASGDSLGLAPTYAIGEAFFPGLSASGWGTTGEIGSGSADMDVMDAVGADRPYAYGSARMAVPRAVGYNWLGEDELAIVNFSDAYTDMSGTVELFALIDSDMTIQGLMSVQVLGAASIESAMQWGDSYNIQQTINALMRSIMQATSGTLGAAFKPRPVPGGGAPVLEPVRQDEMTVWALHMDAAGSTRYSGYDFTSFAKVDGKYYGCKSDGLYLLEGPDDAGAQVAARVNFGNLSFGTEARKALPYVYVGMASSGDTYLKVTADGQTYTYLVRDNTELMKAHRYELGRGLRASFYELELVSDGTVFDLHSIEFQPIELKRRL